MSAEPQQPSFDFFAGVARQYAAARPEGAGTGRVPLSPLEASFFLSLIAVLTLGVAALILHQARFITFRVAVEDRERALPYLLGQAIRDRDRVVGVSFQQVFQMARVEPVAPAVPEEDSMFANTPEGDEVRAVPLQREAVARRNRQSD